jgi:hypothetical protein
MHFNSSIENVFGQLEGLVQKLSDAELIYNIEHTVHHMALIRVRIDEVSSIAIPGEFGVATSNINIVKRCLERIINEV